MAINDTDPNVGVGEIVTSPPIGVISNLAGVKATVCMAVPLWRYAERIEAPQCQFYGVRNDADFENYSDCQSFWNHLERDNIEYYLMEAQHEIEDELGFFLCPTWVYGKLEDVPNGDFRLIDAEALTIPFITRWGLVLWGGTQGVTLIGDGVAVNHGADPAVVTLATTVTDTDEIKVFHPGSAIQIYPSSMGISGGVLTIEIPRCRMVKESLLETVDIAYDVVANFESVVDVYRFYNDNSSHATLVSPHSCSSSCLNAGCGENTDTACIYVMNQRIGEITMRPATYSGGTWTPNGLSCRCPSLVRLNYQAGMIRVTRQMEDAVIRLAHTKMPKELCGCEYGQKLWERDRNIPVALTEQRLANPFGTMDGAWMAWNFVRANKKGEASIL
jgi:hypothetical protein